MTLFYLQVKLPYDTVGALSRSILLSVYYFLITRRKFTVVAVFGIANTAQMRGIGLHSSRAISRNYQSFNAYLVGSERARDVPQR